MRVRAGLVQLLTRPLDVDNQRLALASREVTDRLYVQLLGHWDGTTFAAFHSRVASILSSVPPKLDVRVLLPCVGHAGAESAADATTLLCSSTESASGAVGALNEARAGRAGVFSARVVDHMPPLPLPLPAAANADPPSLGAHGNVVLGGTFDRLHNGHKLLLTLSAALATKRVVIGVSGDGTDLVKDKALANEVMQPYSERIAVLDLFLKSIKPTIKVEMHSLSDAFGPSIVDPDLQAIVVTEETKRGGPSVNKRRVANNLCELEVLTVGLVGSDAPEAHEDKVSSTQLRHDALHAFQDGGRPDEWARTTPSNVPYCIGLTGGIASGKSTAAAFLAQQLNCPLIDCDVLGHKTYEPGTSAYDSLVQTFGAQVVSESGAIDRKKLGSIVFGNKEQMKKLTDIVWPAIASLLAAKLEQLGQQGKTLCVVEAAVLVEAGWHLHVDEVWAMVVPEAVACARLKERNGFSEEDALRRIRSQASVRERLAHAHQAVNSNNPKEVTQQRLASAAANAVRRSQTPSIRDQQFPGTLGRRWGALTAAQGVGEDVARKWWRVLRDKHNEGGRFYHTLAHLDAMFGLFDEHKARMQDASAVAFAVFFHDAVYNAREKANEAASAQLWLEFASEASIPSDKATLVQGWIERTAHHIQGSAEGDLALFLDMDLAVLGAPPAVYAQYAEGVRREYHHAPPEQYKTGRLGVLHGFLQQDKLFFTDAIGKEREGVAKANMEQEALRLKAW